MSSACDGVHFSSGRDGGGGERGGGAGGGGGIVLLVRGIVAGGGVKPSRAACVPEAGRIQSVLLASVLVSVLPLAPVIKSCSQYCC